MSKLQDFGDLILLIGDFHIPQRSSAMPQCFQDLLRTDKIKHVLCTGNVGSQDVVDMLHKVAPAGVTIVRGDSDVDFDFPEAEVLQFGAFKVGLIHGHQVIPWDDSEALSRLQRRLGCDIVVTGNTHRHSASETEGCFYVNPGSATGAFHAPSSVQEPPVTPSFMLMAMQGHSVVLYVYEERDGKAHVVMSKFDKPSAP